MVPQGICSRWKGTTISHRLPTITCIQVSRARCAALPSSRMARRVWRYSRGVSRRIAVLTRRIEACRGANAAYRVGSGASVPPSPALPPSLSAPPLLSPPSLPLLSSSLPFLLSSSPSLALLLSSYSPVLCCSALRLLRGHMGGHVGHLVGNHAGESSHGWSRGWVVTWVVTRLVTGVDTWSVVTWW